jgi:hypothetical protein
MAFTLLYFLLPTEHISSWRTSQRSDLLFLLPNSFIHQFDMFVRRLLYRIDPVQRLILAQVTRLFHLLYRVHAVASDISYGDLCLLPDGLALLQQVLPPLLGELRDVDADDVPVAGGGESKPRVYDRLLDRGDRRLVERRDLQLLARRNGYRRHLADGGHGAVVVGLDAVEHAGVRAAGADGGEIIGEVGHGFFHPLVGIHGNQVHLLLGHSERSDVVAS